MLRISTAIQSVVILLVVAADSFGQRPEFNRDIRPILTEHCLACHGSDEESRKADLRLDQREVAIEVGAFDADDWGNSELLSRIFSSDPDEVMPPPGHTTVSDKEKALLKQWVVAGAEYESHWSFIPPAKPDVPPSVGDHSSWPRNAIDNFILRRLVANELAPSGEAPRYTLIRRLYLDLIGLPPTPKQVQEFINDRSNEAYEKVVDELLASQHFGEHWARMWLDLARYADTKGYEKDNHRDIWRYRDWVIAAYNADMPYAQFTTEQLAGDLLPEATTDQLLATAFHRNTMTNDEGGTDNEEFRTIAVKDRVDTTMQVWMGLTMGCAKCHSHKYDPITQEEYYQFFALFNQTEDADRGDENPKVKTPTSEQAEELASLRAEVDALQKTLGGEKENEALAELKKKLEEAKKATPSTPIMRELAKDKLRETFIQVRGNFLDKGDKVTAAVPKAFGQFPSGASVDRRGVAQWLASSGNPLTARVAVNRVWSRIFGIGLVETEEDFGSQGTYPSHPELLDWLATEFQENLDGSHKQLCKLMAMSATYRQSSVVTDQARSKDPRNRLLGRAPRFRLSAETVRDQALVVSELFTPDIGGPSVMPPQPDGIWRTTYNTARWKNAVGKERYRRGLYTYWRRTSPYPSMMTFDAGSREVCLVRRIRTNIPLQALVTMNDPAFVEAAGGLAGRVLASDLSVSEQRIDDVFQRVLVRRAEREEIDRLTRVLNDALEEFGDNLAAATELIEAARLSHSSLDKKELAAWTIVANVLLNLDETLMRN